MKNHSRTIYFVGIGGSSLNGIAQVLAQKGYTVRGSDLAASPITERLTKLGIAVTIGQRAENITKDIDEVIVSSAAISGPGAVEIARARELKIPIHKRTVWWSRLMDEAQYAIAVAGTHGKTSTTAMIGHILAEAGYDPTVLVGGEIPDFGGSVRVGSEKYIVVEADEYDRAFYATRPTIAVITNIDYDHPDTYPTAKDYIAAFRRFARLPKKRHGIVVAFGKDPVLRRALAHWSVPVHWYDLHAVWGQIKLAIPGVHMTRNASAAGIVAHELGVKSNVIKRALRSFKGVQRRFERIGVVHGIPVYDDYAHHPTELAATIAAARELTDKKIAVVFQPHQRVRTQYFLDQFAEVLKLADSVALLPLFTVVGREEDISITSDDIVRKMHNNTKLIEKDDILTWIQQHQAQEYGLILFCGAGTISTWVREQIEQHDG